MNQGEERSPGLALVSSKWIGGEIGCPLPANFGECDVGTFFFLLTPIVLVRYYIFTNPDRHGDPPRSVRGLIVVKSVKYI